MAESQRGRGDVSWVSLSTEEGLVQELNGARPSLRVLLCPLCMVHCARFLEQLSCAFGALGQVRYATLNHVAVVKDGFTLPGNSYKKNLLNLFTPLFFSCIRWPTRSGSNLENAQRRFQ